MSNTFFLIDHRPHPRQTQLIPEKNHTKRGLKPIYIEFNPLDLMIWMILFIITTTYTIEGLPTD